MKNYEFYKGDAKALQAAFRNFCCKSKSCEKCSYLNRDPDAGCELLFACAEHVESKPPAPPKRGAYTYEEAKGLLGRRLEAYNGDDGGRTCQIVIEVTEGNKLQTYVNGLDFEGWTSANATIDGKPFGVPEKEGTDATEEGAER